MTTPSQPNTTSKHISRKSIIIIAVLVLIVVIAGFIIQSLITSQQMSTDLNNLVNNEVVPSSKYIMSYSIGGEYGSILQLRLSDDFDNLSLQLQWSELKMIMDKYDAPRSEIAGKYYPNYLDNASVNILSDILANTSKNKYEFSSTFAITVNGDVHLSDEFGLKFSTGQTSVDTTLIEPTDDEKAFAWTAAIQEVKARLKAPLTAKFPFSYYGQYIMKSGSSTFIVESYVDAENSFGAKLRSNFKVVIEKTGDNSYNVISVEIGN